MKLRCWVVFLLITIFSSGIVAQTERRSDLRRKILSQYDSFGVDSLVANYLFLKGIPIRENNSVTLLPSGKEKFESLLNEVCKAKFHIHMEYFNFRHDSISNVLFSLLGEKVRQGVEVRVLFDAFGNMSNDSPLKKQYLDSLRNEGIQIVKVDPITFPWLNHVATRDHRKLVVIDGRIAYLGGMNVADYYIKGLEKIGTWNDMHCRIEGDAVADVQRVFARMWTKEVGEYLADSVLQPLGDVFSSSDSASLAVVDRSPKLQPNAIKDMYALSIEGASQRIRIVNPYFVPTSAISKSISKALKQGVEVEIMVPEKSDIPFTPDAMKHKLRRLSKAGAKVYLYQGGFLHAKTMTVDSCLSTIGSANLNSRSLRYDYETNAFFFDREVTRQLDSIYDQNKEKSILLDNTYWKKRSKWRKFVGWFANIFTPFL